MKISVLASGSKGNSSFISFKSANILIDVGISYKSLKAKLEELDISIQSINYVFITHTHKDHILGLKNLAKNTNIKVIVTKNMYEEISSLVSEDKIEIIEEKFTKDSLEVEVIKGSHDSDEVSMFVFKEVDKELAYVTDTGYININNHKKLENKDVYLFESNHDVEMLMNGRYPHHLKRRVLSDEGHLSNEMATKYLCKFVGEKTKAIFLIHLSEKNNTPEIAFTTLKEGLLKAQKKVDKIIISDYSSITEVLEI